MYWLRGAAVSVAMFTLVYLAISSLLVAILRAKSSWVAKHSADGVFLLRVTPLLCAYAALMLLTIPSYRLFEPPTAQESFTWPALLVVAIGFTGISTGVFACIRAWVRNRRAIGSLAVAAQGTLGGDVDSLRLLSDKPLFFITGLFRPKLFVSDAAVSMLTPAAFEAAVRHEIAHAQQRDNVKQLLLRFCAFPGLADLDRAWLRAAEIAADDAAVHDKASAIELASALINVARASVSNPELSMSLVPESDSPLAQRVNRLLDWNGVTHRDRLPQLMVTAGIVAVVVVMNAAWLVSGAHEFTEMLFRR